MMSDHTNVVCRITAPRGRRAARPARTAASDSDSPRPNPFLALASCSPDRSCLLLELLLRCSALSVCSGPRQGVF